MSGYSLLPEAYADLDEIRSYIARDSLDAADRIVDDLLDAVAALVPMPRIGHRRTDLTTRPFRFWTVRPYLIVYAPEESPLLVVAFLHGSRDPETLATLLEERGE